MAVLAVALVVCEPKIFAAVIYSVPFDMVNVFFRGKLSAKHP